MNTPKTLKEILSEISDSRSSLGKRHSLLSILLLSCLAMLCGITSYSAISDWGRLQEKSFLLRLGFDRKPPCAATFHNVFKEINLDEFESKLTEWANAILKICPPEENALAIDGKCLRGSRKQGAPAAHMVSAVGHGLGITLIQKSVNEKTNEIPVTKNILKDISLQGKVITADALITQRKIAEQIVSGGGDYLFIAKGNQAELKKAVRDVFQVPEKQCITKDYIETVNKEHGRCEKRTLRSSVQFNKNLLSNWSGLSQVIEIQRSTVINKTGKIRQETVYAITSLSPEDGSAKRLLKLSRGHWVIENKLHWVKDVVFKEDHSQVRVGSIPQVMSALRNTTISLIRSKMKKGITAMIRDFSVKTKSALVALGC